MEQIKLELQVRKQTGSGAVNRLRLTGVIPGVVYGGEEAALPVQVRKSDFERIMRAHAGESILFAVSLVEDGKTLKDFVALAVFLVLNVGLFVFSNVSIAGGFGFLAAVDRARGCAAPRLAGWPW